MVEAEDGEVEAGAEASTEVAGAAITTGEVEEDLIGDTTETLAGVLPGGVEAEEAEGMPLPILPEEAEATTGDITVVDTETTSGQRTLVIMALEDPEAVQ